MTQLLKQSLVGRLRYYISIGISPSRTFRILFAKIPGIYCNSLTYIHFFFSKSDLEERGPVRKTSCDYETAKAILDIMPNMQRVQGGLFVFFSSLHSRVSRYLFFPRGSVCSRAVLPYEILFVMGTIQSSGLLLSVIRLDM